MSELMINRKLLDILSTPMQILIYIDMMGEGSLMDLVNRSKMSWHTIQKWIPVLEENGLITVREEKTSVGTTKKVVKLTDAGKAVVKKLMELNETLNELGK